VGRDFFNGAGNVGQIAGAVGAQGADVIGGADGAVDDGAFAGLEFEVEAHGLEGQQQIGKDDGGVDAKLFSGGDGDLRGQLGLLADFNQCVMLADLAILLHVAAGLA